MKIIYKYLISIGASPEDAEDIIQETTIKTYTYFNVIDSSKLKAWMFKVSLNHFYNLYKKATITIDLSHKLNNTLISTNTIENVDLKLQTKKIFSKMNKTYKNILILKYQIGLSYKEISKLLNIKESSAKSLGYRAKNIFIELWESENNEIC